MINNETLFKSQRQSGILKLIEERGQITVPEVSDLFNVSKVTARRDLIEMAERGEIRRTHGGALLGATPTEPPVLERAQEQRDEKRRIGKAAAGLVQDGETIFLGSGTTVLAMAKQLNEGIHLTVVTNSLPVVTELSRHPHVEMIIIGGMLRKSEQAMVGHTAEQALQDFRVDHVFMGIRSIDVQNGFTNDDFPDTVLDRTLFKISSQVVVLADHTKFERTSLVHVAPLEAAYMIVTDSGTPAETIDLIQASGLRVLRV